MGAHEAGRVGCDGGLREGVQARDRMRHCGERDECGGGRGRELRRRLFRDGAGIRRTRGSTSKPGDAGGARRPPRGAAATSRPATLAACEPNGPLTSTGRDSSASTADDATADAEGSCSHATRKRSRTGPRTSQPQRRPRSRRPATRRDRCRRRSAGSRPPPPPRRAATVVPATCAKQERQRERHEHCEPVPVANRPAQALDDGGQRATRRAVVAKPGNSLPTERDERDRHDRECDPVEERAAWPRA